MQKKLTRRLKHEKDILRAQELLKNGLSYREVMRAMGKKDTKTIYRWARYVV